MHPHALLFSALALLAPSVVLGQLTDAQCQKGCQDAVVVGERCPTLKTGSAEQVYGCLCATKLTVDSFFECVACNNPSDAAGGVPFEDFQYLAEICYQWVLSPTNAVAFAEASTEQQVVEAFSATLLPKLASAHVSPASPSPGAPAPTQSGASASTPLVSPIPLTGSGSAPAASHTHGAGGGGGGKGHSSTTYNGFTPITSSSQPVASSPSAASASPSATSTNAAAKVGDISLGYFELSVIGLLGMLLG